MPIIIPSKSIYEKQNDIVISNAISQINASLTKMTEVVEEDTFITQKEYDITTDILGGANIEGQGNVTVEPPQTTTIQTKYFPDYDKTMLALAGSTVKSVHFSLRLPTETANYVLNNETVTVRLARKIHEISPSEVNVTFDYGTTNIIFMTAKYDVPFKDEVFVDPQSLPQTISFEYNGVSVSHNTGASTDKIILYLEKNEDEDFYNASFDANIALRTVCVGGEINKSGVVINIDSAKIVEYRPLGVTLTINGKTFRLNEENIITSVSNGNNANVFSTQSNSLMQYADEYAIKSRLTNTLDFFENGRETATLLCDIGEYFDENGNKKISAQTADKMTFNLYDEVAPMIKNGKGQDVPMSLTQYGEPKTFEVLGTSIFFDGAVWQKLHLREKGVFLIPDLNDGTRGLSYQLSDDKTYYICTGLGTATSSDIVITSRINGKRVTEIASEAFKNSDITNVDLSRVRTINSNAFMYCEKLENIGLIDVSSIGSSALEGCINLTDISLSDELHKLENRVFANCNSLTKVDIHCRSLENLEAENGVFELAGSSGNGIEVYIYPKVSRIPDYLFCPATDISKRPKILYVGFRDVEDSALEYIGDYAFYSLAELEEVSIPHFVSYIGVSAFENCTNLGTIAYNGTMAEWSAIQKGQNWNNGIGARRVRCTDGAVSL